MNKEIKVLFGIMMSIEKSEVRYVLSKLKPEWFTLENEKTVYKLIVDLIADNEEVNLLSVTMRGMKEKIPTKNIHIYTSECVSSVSRTDYLNVDIIIEVIKYHYVTTGVKDTSQKLNDLLSNDDIDFDKYVDILNDGIRQFSDEMLITEQTIQNIVMNVLDRHEKAKHGDIGGILLGFNNMRDDIILEPVDMMVVGARPAMGKTSFGVATLCQLAFHEKRKVVYFNLEMSNSQLMRRIISNLTGIDSNKIKKGLCSDKELNQIHSVITMQEMNNITLYEGSHTIQQMKMKLTELKYSNQVDVFIVDYLQKITPERGKSRYEQVTQVSNGLKYISQNMKIPSIALAQLGRDAGKHGNRPILPDLRESGEIEQDASIVAFLHRPEYYGNMTDDIGRSTEGFAEFIVAKNREGENPILEFTVDLKTSRWIDNAPQKNNFVEPYNGFHNDNPF
jgi:replicative DNA helicase